MGIHLGFSARGLAETAAREDQLTGEPGGIRKTAMEAISPG
jgi:hypothetical protein